MIPGVRGAILVFVVCAAVYALWSMYRLRREARRSKVRDTPARGCQRRKEVIGPSRFVLPRRESQPQAAMSAESAASAEKARIFAPASVQEHPRQIPPEKLDEVFGAPPEGASNEPDSYDLPLYEEPDYAAEDDDDEDDGPPPGRGRPRATGASFEKIGEAYRSVAHDNPLTEAKQQEVGHTLLGLKQTDMFEAIVLARPDGSDKVGRLIDSYLEAFHRKIASQAAESPSPQVPVPEGFDVRSYV